RAGDLRQEIAMLSAALEPAQLRVLCISSKAADPILEEVLRSFKVTAVHDARLALRKGSLGTYDFFLAYDPRGARAPALLWQHLRHNDVNTPFVMVCGEDMPADVAGGLKPGFDAVLRYPCSAHDILHAISSLMSATERRNAHARTEAARTVSNEIHGRLAALEHRVHLSRQSLARAQEHVMRAIALRSFTSSGGTRSDFENVWLEVFESALRSSHDEAKTQKD
ncbi:MAG TPA: hypothetical protein VNT02_09760, partial [Burkholderiales bacterium]|nr:hypothetical protein [Burkholderiales bacterium]